VATLSGNTKRGQAGLADKGKWKQVFWSACFKYEGWNFNSGNYLFTTDTK